MGGSTQQQHRLLDETEIVDGIDELGVLLYGHQANAYWYGSRLSIEETRSVAPYQNATGLQVTSALWAVLLVRGYRRPRTWLLPGLLGLLEPALAYLGDTAGLSRTTAVDGSILSGLEPAPVVVLAALLLGEIVTRSVILAVLLAFGGRAVLAGAGHSHSASIGDLYVAYFTVFDRRGARGTVTPATSHPTTAWPPARNPQPTNQQETRHPPQPGHRPPAQGVHSTFYDELGQTARYARLVTGTDASNCEGSGSTSHR